MKGKIILAVGAHQDDIDFTAAGSIAHWIKMGAEAYYLVATDGSKGSPDPEILSEQLSSIRRREQEDAAAVLGVEKVYFLNHIDGELINSLELRKEIVIIIRKVKPDIVITFDPTFVYSPSHGFINHPDHRAIGQATLDAIYPCARDSRAFPELLKDELNPHKTKEVMLVNFNHHNFFVDISGTLELKLEALRKHVSQNPDVSAMEKWVKERAKEMGEKINAKYAEGFVRIEIS